MARYLYSEIAQTLTAWNNCQNHGNTEWKLRHESMLDKLESMLPSGSGFDSGTKLDRDRSHATKLVFETSFHHMNDAGYYDGWTEHTVTVTPSFLGAFDIRVSGRNRNDIKEYIVMTFREALTQDCEYEVYRNACTIEEN